jgi:hypothetical protein
MPRKFILFALCLCTLGALGASLIGTKPVSAASEQQAASMKAQSSRDVVPRGETRSQGKAPKGAEVVYYGIEPVQVYGISLADDLWKANFWMWYRWKGPYDPTSSTTFNNSTNAETNFQVTYSYVDANGKQAPVTLANGYKYQLAYIQAGFANEFRLQRYPLDRQELAIRFENTTYPFSQLVYEPDPQRSFDQRFTVPSWLTTSLNYKSYVKHYTTNFGNADAAGPFQDWSLGTYSINIQRPVSHFIGKLLLPLLIVLTASILVLFLKTEHEISRLALTGTGLVTLIFLQTSYSTDLPPSAPLVLLDKVYIVGYLVVLSTFVRIVWETLEVSKNKREADRLQAVDRRIAIAIGICVALGLTTLFIFG